MHKTILKKAISFYKFHAANRKIGKIFTHLTKKEKSTLYELSFRSVGNFVEIGSYIGASSCIIASGIKDSKNASTLYCVDTWKNDAMSEGYIDTFDAFKKNTAGFIDIIYPIRKKSIEAARSFDKRIDFLFIDGDHSYESVKCDIDSWFPKLNPNALLIFHDIGWAEGVQQAIREEVAPRANKEGRLKNLYWAWI